MCADSHLWPSDKVCGHNVHRARCRFEQMSVIILGHRLPWLAVIENGRRGELVELIIACKWCGDAVRNAGYLPVGVCEVQARRRRVGRHPRSWMEGGLLVASGHVRRSTLRRSHLHPRLAEICYRSPRGFGTHRSPTVRSTCATVSTR